MRAFLTCIATLALSAGAAAQTNRGGISGTVTDKSGAVVPEVTVTITNVGTNETYRVTTSKQGAYSIQNLDPVVYKVEVDVAGFKKAIVENVKVDTATIETVNLTLAPGNLTTEVQVTEQAPLQNSENGTLGQTISERLLTDVPLLNRSVLDLAVVTPNVSGDVGTEDPQLNNSVPVPGFNLSVNGGRPGSNYMIADGVSNTGVGLAREVVAFSPETVQEFTVQTSAYSAAFGHTGGGVINLTTKSGTNEYHGAATVYHRNPAANAAPWTNATVNRPVSNLRYTQMSFTFGGPVVIPVLYNGRNRTFFFAAFEPRYQTDISQGTGLLPTDAMRQGDFSGLVAVQGGWVPASVAAQFPTSIQTGASTSIYQLYDATVDSSGKPQLIPIALSSTNPQCGTATAPAFCPFARNQIPASFQDPVAQTIFSKYEPKAGPYFLNGNGELSNYVYQTALRNDQKRYTVRLDQVTSDKNRAFFRFTGVPVIGNFVTNVPLGQTGASYSFSRQYTVADTQIFSPSMYNDVRFNYTYGRFSGTFSPEWDTTTGRNLSTELGLPSVTKGGLPLFTFDSSGDRGGRGSNVGTTSSQINDNSEKQYQIIDNLFINHGSMSWTFGFELEQQSLDTVFYNFAAGGRYDFRALQTTSNGATSGAGGNVYASFLEGVWQGDLLANSLIPYSYQWRNAAGFVQNDWKVRPNVTLNLGLRYSLQIPRSEADNLQGYWQPSQAKLFPTVNAAGNPAPLSSVAFSSGPTATTVLLPSPISSASVPPFTYSGAGPTSRFLRPINWMDFEPRLGFAYVPRLFGLKNLVLRGGYGISHLPLTGQNRNPNPSFAGFRNFATAVDSNYVLRLSNPPSYNPITPQQAEGLSLADSNGFSYLNSINIPAGAISTQTKTPYIQNWNLSLSRSFGSRMLVELAYVGTKGTHLYLSRKNLNLPDSNWITYLEDNGVSATQAIADPLHRCVPGMIPDIAGGTLCSGTPPPRGQPATHNTITIPIGSLYSPYLGFGSLLTFDDAGADSIRHAGYISIVHRPSHGFTWSTNYTFGKSIDDASNGNPDKNVLTSSKVDGGQITYGGTPQGDRSVSGYDVKHTFNFVGIYDLPVGRGRRFFTNALRPLDAAIGGWTISGVERLYTGFPSIVTEATANDLGNSQTHDIRPNIIPGVPLINPLWRRSCPLGALCEPYLNPAAFEERPVGALGNAPRTLDGARGPLQQTLDLSVQKNFQITERWRIQLRVDAINALNHPLFRPPVLNEGGAGANGIDVFGGGGNGGRLSLADYNTWAAFNNKPQATSANDPNIVAINNRIDAQRGPTPPGVTIANGTKPVGPLPANFFTVPVPQGFAFMNANSFDIADPTLSGYKLYRVRQDYNSGSASFFGTLHVASEARHLQFGLRIFF